MRENPRLTRSRNWEGSLTVWGQRGLRCRVELRVSRSSWSCSRKRGRNPRPPFSRSRCTDYKMQQTEGIVVSKMMGSPFSVLGIFNQNLPKKVEELICWDLSVSVLVGLQNESGDFLLGDGPVLLHVVERIVDHGDDLAHLEEATLVGIVCVEYFHHCLSEVLVCIFVHFHLLYGCLFYF